MVQEIAQLHEESKPASWPPVPKRTQSTSGLSSQIRGKIRKGIPPTHAFIGGDLAITSSEHNRLEDDSEYAVDVLNREIEDRTHLVRVDSIRDSDLKRGLKARLVRIPQCLGLDIE